MSDRRNGDHPRRSRRLCIADRRSRRTFRVTRHPGQVNGRDQALPGNGARGGRDGDHICVSVEGGKSRIVIGLPHAQLAAGVLGPPLRPAAQDKRGYGITCFSLGRHCVVSA
jgi:hypothetical protein